MACVVRRAAALCGSTPEAVVRKKHTNHSGYSCARVAGNDIRRYKSEFGSRRPQQRAARAGTRQTTKVPYPSIVPLTTAAPNPRTRPVILPEEASRTVPMPASSPPGHLAGPAQFWKSLSTELPSAGLRRGGSQKHDGAHQTSVQESPGNRNARGPTKKVLCEQPQSHAPRRSQPAPRLARQSREALQHPLALFARPNVGAADGPPRALRRRQPVALPTR